MNHNYQIAACQRCGGTTMVDGAAQADLWLRIHDCGVFRQHEDTKATLEWTRAEVQKLCGDFSWSHLAAVDAIRCRLESIIAGPPDEPST